MSVNTYFVLEFFIPKLFPAPYPKFFSGKMHSTFEYFFSNSSLSLMFCEFSTITIGYFLSKPALNRFKTRIDPRKYNGAVLLGLNGIVVKSHGRSDANGFANAINVAYDLCKNNFNKKIIYDIKRTINKK